MTKLVEKNPQGTANIADDRVLAVGFLFLSDEEKNTLQNAIEKYGDRAQVIKAIEEFDELNHILCRYLNNRFSLEDLTSELVDASIMLKQLFDIISTNFGKHEVEGYVKEWQEYKIKRLAERLNDGTNPKPYC
jgi:hypothetical protein